MKWRTAIKVTLSQTNCCRGKRTTSEVAADWHWL